MKNNRFLNFRLVIYLITPVLLLIAARNSNFGNSVFSQTANKTNDFAPESRNYQTSVNSSVQINLRTTADDFPHNNVVISKYPDNGYLEGAGTMYVYTPEEDFAGRDSFEWYLQKANTKSKTASVFINVDESNVLQSSNTGGIDTSSGENLVAYYSFDQDGSVGNEVGSCSDCRNQGAIWTPEGREGGAYLFDGESSVYVGDTDYLGGGNAMSLSAWIKPDFDSSSNERQYIYSQGGSVQLFYLPQVSGWRFVLRTDEGNIRLDIKNVSWEPGTWHHIAASYDGHMTNVYWDGSIRGSTMGGADEIVMKGGSRAYIGTASIGRYNFQGVIDEVKIWDEALTSEDIDEEDANESGSDDDTGTSSDDMTQDDAGDKSGGETGDDGQTPPDDGGTQEPPADQTDDFVYCSDHDPETYHALFDQEQSCWYDHEHGDDPSTVNDIFGSVSAWWGSNQSISYPWQTYGFEGSAAGGGDNYPVRTGSWENDAKHQGYKWYVRRDLDCYSQFTDGCVTAFRTLGHAIGSAQGAVTRFHSFSTEMVLCPEDEPNNCGILRTGGWQDKGPLVIDGEILPEFGPQNGSARLHYYEIGDARFGTWYGGTRLAETVQQFEDMWGNVLPSNPMELNFFCPQAEDNCGFNNSKRQLHIVGAGISRNNVRWLTENGYIENGRATYAGFTDRYGNIITDNSCTSASSTDCVPLEMENVDVTTLYQYRGDAREYDTSIGVLSSSPIRYPN